MNILMISLLILPVLSYMITRWLPDKYLCDKRWLSSAALILTGLTGISLFVILRLINEAEYVRTIAFTWLKIPDHSFLISLTLNNFLGMLLALWAVGALIFLALTSSNFFDHRTYRENLINLSIGTFATNGLILTNDFLLLLIFWALLDLIGYRISFRNDYNAADYRRADSLTITGYLLLILAAFILFGMSGTFQIDQIFRQIIAGEITSRQLLWPGILIALAVIFRLFQPDVRYEADQNAKLQISDEFMLFNGLMLSSPILLIKLFPILPQICLKGLMIIGGINALIVLIIHLTKANFRQFLRLNTLLQINLVIVTISVGVVSVSAYLFIVLFITNLLTIVLIRDFESVTEPVGFSLGLPIRIMIWFSLIGLPLTMAFNSRLLLFQIVWATPAFGLTLRTIMIGLLGTMFFLNSAVMFRLFLRSGAFKPATRKISPTKPLTYWIAAGLAIACLYPVFTWPDLNPLTTKLNGIVFYAIHSANIRSTDYTAVRLNSMIIYMGILLIGLLTGYILTKYLKIDGLALWLTRLTDYLRTHGILPMRNFTNLSARKLVGFDAVQIPTFGQRLSKALSRAIGFINQFNDKGARQLARLDSIPGKLSDKIVTKIERMNFYNLIGIVLFILLITILISII